MSNKKDKVKWQKMQDNNKKRCINCTQLHKHCDGNYICYLLKSPDEKPNGGLLVNNPNELRVACYDKYNGKNVK